MESIINAVKVLMEGHTFKKKGLDSNHLKEGVSIKTPCRCIIMGHILNKLTNSWVSKSLIVNQYKDIFAETIRKFAVNLEVPSEEVGILKRLALWPISSLKDLAEMLRAFAGFKTKDIEETGSRCGKLFSSGKPMPVNKVLFKKIGRLTPKQAETMKEPVINKEISLKEAVNNSMKELDREKTLAMVAQQLGHISTEEVKTIYSEKFTNVVLDSFRGAIIGKRRKKSNQEGRYLVEYCDMILLTKETNTIHEPQIDICVVKECAEGVQGKVDVAVFLAQNARDSQNTILEKLKDLKQSNSCVSLVCAFEENVELNTLKENVKEMLEYDYEEVYFKSKKIVLKKQFECNIMYGLVAGKIFEPAVKILNGFIDEDLKKVVSSLSPPKARLALFHMAEKTPVPIIHLKETEKVVYFVKEEKEGQLSALLNTYRGNEGHKEIAEEVTEVNNTENTNESGFADGELGNSDAEICNNDEETNDEYSDSDNA